MFSATARPPGLARAFQTFRTLKSKVLKALRVATVKLVSATIVRWRDRGAVAAASIDAGATGFFEAVPDVREAFYDGHSLVLMNIVQVYDIILADNQRSPSRVR